MNIQPLLIEAERYLVEKDVDRAAEIYVHAQQQCAGRSPMPLVGLARIAILMQNFDDARQLLEGVNKLYHTGILISGETASRLEGAVRVRLVDRVIVKGKSEPVDIWTPCSRRTGGRGGIGKTLEPGSDPNLMARRGA